MIPLIRRPCLGFSSIYLQICFEPLLAKGRNSFGVHCIILIRVTTLSWKSLIVSMTN